MERCSLLAIPWKRRRVRGKPNGDSNNHGLHCQDPEIQLHWMGLHWSARWRGETLFHDLVAAIPEIRTDLNFQAYRTHIFPGNASIYPYCPSDPCLCRQCTAVVLYTLPIPIIKMPNICLGNCLVFTQITHICIQAMVYPNCSHFLRQWFTNQTGTTLMRRVAAACSTW